MISMYRERHNREFCSPAGDGFSVATAYDQTTADGCSLRANHPSKRGHDSPCRELALEISRLSAELEESGKKCADLERRRQTVENELEMTSLQFEAALGKANQAAFRAEVANIELNQIFNTSVDAIWVLDKDYTILRINETFLGILRRSRQQTVGAKCYSVLAGPNCRTVHCPLVRLSRDEAVVDCDLEFESADGSRRIFLVTAKPYNGLDGEVFGIVEAHRDITDRKRAEEALQRANEELHRLASLDGLTRIANRRRFDECLLAEWKRMARENKPLSLILGDIDCFKLFNDTCGHQPGDDCLRSVARCLAAQLKRPSDLAARYGGEEFVALLPDTDSQGALLIAESIRAGIMNLQIEHRSSPVSSHVTMSLGVATVVPGPDLDLASLIDTADRALYEAKGAGRNRVVFRQVP